MAPEQFRGQACSTTDLYGLGATLIHLIEPLVEERFESASAALLALTRPELTTTKSLTKRPAGSCIQLNYSRHHYRSQFHRQG